MRIDEEEQNRCQNQDKETDLTQSIGKAAETVISVALKTELKISETKERLLTSKDSNSLQTDKKSSNFHSEKRDRRLQVERLADSENSNEENESTEKAETDENNENNDNNTNNSETTTKNKQAPNNDSVSNDISEAKLRRKKVIQIKMRKRMSEQRQRKYLDQHNSRFKASLH